MHTTTAPLRFLTRRSIGAAAGFSLVEVIMALGVMSVSMMGMLGLLSVGLTHFQKSMDLTVRSQITQDLVYMLQRTPFTDLSSGTTERFYDDEGRTLGNGQSAQASYKAEVQVGNALETSGRCSPTWNFSTPPSQFKSVTISITRVGNSGVKPYEFTTYVANTGL
ncbi:hypothetical protein DB346_09600 [Verrucomicrobia bacterium LW23]|nr:hypothetical protein DB346_09600 [Verrucomicrobia bacterium LW23]